jgi:hypothetical protein
MPLVRPDPGLFRSLFGSHLTLGLNLCGLVAAAYAIIEGAYIVHQHSGYYRPQDASVFLFPALVMFIVRNRIFSCCFLVLYIGLSTQLFFEARSISLGTYKNAGAKDPLGILAIVFVVSAVCLAAYLAAILIRLAASQLTSKK